MKLWKEPEDLGFALASETHALLVARSPRGYVWQFRFSCLFPAAGTGLWKGVNSQKEERWWHNKSELRLRDPVAQCSIRGLASHENLKQARELHGVFSKVLVKGQTELCC